MTDQQIPLAARKRTHPVMRVKETQLVLHEATENSGEDEQIYRRAAKKRDKEGNPSSTKLGGGHS